MTLRIGLTGNIGSGKSSAAKAFEVLGIPVFYADDESKSLLKYLELIAPVVCKKDFIVVTENLISCI